MHQPKTSWYLKLSNDLRLIVIQIDIWLQRALNSIRFHFADISFTLSYALATVLSAATRTEIIPSGLSLGVLLRRMKRFKAGCNPAGTGFAACVTAPLEALGDL
uniref:Cyclin_C domain-containing protein n=1 Tax=Steinernema glaseri TaxID=37863 RepID=A0A1I8ABM3_9BILA